MDTRLLFPCICVWQMEPHMGQLWRSWKETIISVAVTDSDVVLFAVAGILDLRVFFSSSSISMRFCQRLEEQLVHLIAKKNLNTGRVILSVKTRDCGPLALPAEKGCRSSFCRGRFWADPLKASELQYFDVKVMPSFADAQFQRRSSC